MRQCAEILHAGIILTQNPDREILEKASLAVDDGKIADLGPEDEILSNWRANQEIDLRDCLLMPGLINAHSHASMTFLRGAADDLPLMRWLEDSVFPVEARLEPEICRLGALLGYAEMLARGITACIDMYIFEEAVFEAAEIAGLRCLGGEATFGFPSAACADYRAALASTRDMAEKYAGHDRISVAVNPHSVYTTSPEILRACRDLARSLGLPLHIHLAETEKETALSLEMHGKRPVEYCQSLGLFDVRTIAAHAVELTEKEIDALAAGGVSAVHCPSSNMKLASGLSPVPRMLEKGLNVALGTDGPASNNQLNIFMEMRAAALVHKLAGGDPTVMGASTILDMATLGGAIAFGNPNLGSLEPGKAADCIALDMSLPNMLPMFNPASQAVYAATGHECRMSMVGGEILYHNGRYSRFDIADLRKEILELRKFVCQGQ